MQNANKPDAPKPAAQSRKPLTQQYRPPFTPLTPESHDLYAASRLAMLTRPPVAK